MSLRIGEKSPDRVTYGINSKRGIKHLPGNLSKTLVHVKGSIKALSLVQSIK